MKAPNHPPCACTQACRTSTAPSIRNLSSALWDRGRKMEATEALRGLISEIRMVPDADAPNGHHIELAGEFPGILGLGAAEPTRPAQYARAGSISLVAGVGFEPTTFRL